MSEFTLKTQQDAGIWGGTCVEPPEGRDFQLLLVQTLLFALGQEGPSRAAFVEQLRPP